MEQSPVISPVIGHSHSHEGEWWEECSSWLQRRTMPEQGIKGSTGVCQVGRAGEGSRQRHGTRSVGVCEHQAAQWETCCMRTIHYPRVLDSKYRHSQALHTLAQRAGGVHGRGAAPRGV